MAQVNLKFEDNDPVLKELADCAKLLASSPSAIARKIVVDNIAAFKIKASEAAAILNEPAAPSRVPKRRK